MVFREGNSDSGKGVSTVDAIRAVVHRAEKASTKKRDNWFCAVVTIGVQNDSAGSEATVVALYGMRVSSYLCSMLLAECYFQNRVLVYDT